MEIVWLLILWIHVIAAGCLGWRQPHFSNGYCAIFSTNPTTCETNSTLDTNRQTFEPIVWGCVLVLFFTGIGNTFNAIDFSSPIVTSFMRTLLIKLILFIALLILTSLHSFVYAPRLLVAIETLDETLERTTIRSQTTPYTNVNCLKFNGCGFAVDSVGSSCPSDGDMIFQYN